MAAYSTIARRITKRLPLSHLTATIMAPHVSKLSTFRNGSHIHDLATKSPKFNSITAPNLFFSLRNFSSQIPPDDNDDEDIKHLNRRQMEGLIDFDEEENRRNLTPLQKETLDEILKMLKNKRGSARILAVQSVVNLGLALSFLQLRPWLVELSLELGLPLSPLPIMYDLMILISTGSGFHIMYRVLTTRNTEKSIMSQFKEMKHHNLGLTHLLEQMKCSSKNYASVRRHIGYTLYPTCFMLVFMIAFLYNLNH